MVYMMPSVETTDPDDGVYEEGAAGTSNNHKSVNGPSSPANGNARANDSNYV